MKIVAMIPIPNANGSQDYLVQATENELNTVAGVLNHPPIAGRYVIGTEIECAKVYQKLAWLEKHQAQIPEIAAELRTMATNLEAALPAETQKQKGMP